MNHEEILWKTEVPEDVPTGIRIQYAEGFDAITEDTVKKIFKKVRKRIYKHLYLTLDPYGESTFLQMDSENGYISLAIGEEICRNNHVTWTFYLSYNQQYADSDEEAPIRSGQDIFLKKYTIQDAMLAAKCVEWFIRTGTPYPGIDWAKRSS